MTNIDLASIGPGFSHPAYGSQSIFRAALEALSLPGRLVEAAHDACVPGTGHSSAAAMLLSLMDSTSRLWLSPSRARDGTAAWLRFHTGCRLVDGVAQADFAWATLDEMPPLAALAQGSDERPEGSATCLVDATTVAIGLANAADKSACFSLRGPGIRDTVRLRIGGLEGESAAAFAGAWAANHAAFPKGVDVFIATPRHLVGLPRTTRIELET